jgi:hypothetical protein
MLGYRKLAMWAGTIILQVLLIYFGKDAIMQQALNTWQGVANGIFDLIILFIPTTGAAAYSVVNIKAKTAMATAVSATGQLPIQAPTTFVLTNEAVAARLGLPLDINAVMAQAEAKRQIEQKSADTPEVGLYFALHDVGFATPTTSLQHGAEFYDLDVEAAKKAWYSETERIVPGHAFTWDDKDKPENLSAGKLTCPALNSKSWARSHGLDLLYVLIGMDINSALWLEQLAGKYPSLNVAAHYGTNATLAGVGLNAKEVYEALESGRVKP